MGHQIFAILLAAFSVLHVECITVRKDIESNLVYLGSGWKQAMDMKTGEITPQYSLYFRSLDTVAWTGVEENCKTFLGVNGTTLRIETMDEFDNVTQFMYNTEENVQYWIGGEWSPTYETFIWTNGIRIGDEWEGTWYEGYPDSPTFSTKMMLYKFQSVHFRVALLEEEHFYLCELPMEPEKCLVDNDLVIILDGSISVGADNFVLSLEFVRDLAREWFQHIDNRISFITYGTEAAMIFNLDNRLTWTEVQETILNAPYPNEAWTNTHLGLELALAELELQNRTVAQNVVLLTDGASSDPSQTLEVAARIHGAGVEVFVVGIGRDVDAEELLAVAGNQPDHVFSAEDFSDLVDFLAPISEEICAETGERFI